MAIPKCFFVLLCIAIVVLNAGKNPFIDNHYISLLQKSNKQINLFYIYLKIFFIYFWLQDMQLQRLHHVRPCSTRGHVQIFLTAISIACPLDGNVVDYVKHPVQGLLLLVFVKSKNRFWPLFSISLFSHCLQLHI